MYNDGNIRISLKKVPMANFHLLPLDFRGQPYPFAYKGVGFPFHVHFDGDLASVLVVIVEQTGTMQQDAGLIENHSEAFTLSRAISPKGPTGGYLGLSFDQWVEPMANVTEFSTY